MSSVAMAGQQMDEAKKWVFVFCGNLDSFLIIQLQKICPSLVKLKRNQLYQTFFPMISLNGKRKQKQSGIRLSTR